MIVCHGIPDGDVSAFELDLPSVDGAYAAEYEHEPPTVHQDVVGKRRVVAAFMVNTSRYCRGYFFPDNLS